VARRDVVAEALAPPVEERARIVRQLLSNVDADESDAPAAIEEAWTAEITRRIDEIDAETAAVEDWPIVRDELRARVKARRAGE
jgi:putative addiction module component (TIGR02574 family)